MGYLLFLYSCITWAQTLPKVDFIALNATVLPNFEKKDVNGHCHFVFKVNAPTDTIRIDAKAMRFSGILINGKAVEYKNNGKELLLYTGFKKGKNQLDFDYYAQPKQALYYIGTAQNYQIWTQGQGRYTSHWLPSFDDVNEKLTFSISVTTLENEEATRTSLTAISNGELVQKETFRAIQAGKIYTTWNYQMKKPMASYLVMLAIGEFVFQTHHSATGIPLERYIQPKDATKMDYTYMHSDRIFDFLEKEIGVKYPWKIYRQVPVRDFLYAGMENTTSTIFDQDFVVDSIANNDRNYVNVNAHELAHHWFGDLITAKSGKHHWLQEGFATYYALLAEKEIFGDDYFYQQLYSYANRIKVAAKSDTIPVMNEKASSLSFYQKGALALHYLRDQIGKRAFDKTVKAYLKHYQYTNVETADFLAFVRKYADFDTETFQKTWLESAAYPEKEINACLQKSAFIQELIALQKDRSKPLRDKLDQFRQLLQSQKFWPLKSEVIYQLKNEPFEESEPLYRLALQQGDIKVVKTVSELLTKVPASFQAEYEQLLSVASYEVRANAFLNLLHSFPEEKERYFEIVKDWQGANDKEVRILVLTAYLNAMPETAPLYSIYKNELIGYTGPDYESVTRIPAFQNALTSFPEDVQLLKNLVNATHHPKWQMVKYGRDMIRKYVKTEKYRILFNQILPDLSPEEQAELKRLMQS
ncbi:M1 family peptidase [Flavobacterium stagni]|uniref:Aminopeptidase N n=1 Tax=Flavobacterium stagni TaxID=2506421 RepID=A0A4Q1KAK6_9FLAO|nr:M1 family peptidase [Flavobacterium stagni]